MLKLVKSKNKKICVIFIIVLLFLSFTNVSTSADAEDRPDLVIYSIDMPDDIVEGENLGFIVKIKNQGEKNILSGTKIGLALKLDGTIVASNSTLNGLLKGSSIFINLSWTPAFSDIGAHLLSIEVDHEEIVLESNENNNVWDTYITVLEGNTDLEIISITPLSDLVINQTTTILSTVKNHGKDSTETIYAQLNSSKDGKVELVMTKDSLLRDNTFIFSFNWTPSSLGNQTISVDLSYEGKTHDFEEKSVVVGVYQLEWWNESWHYRYFLVANGNGNISLSLNFTEILDDLDVFSQTFENDTIRIIEYTTKGKIVGEIEEYKFNESIGFDQVNDATGNLLWKVAGSSKEKYYCVYFDVSSNVGDRTELTETEHMVESGNITLGVLEFVEGWWAEITGPIDNSYALISSSVDITVSTSAKAESVTAFVFTNDDESHSFTLYLDDIGDAVLWEYEDFVLDEEGGWTIRVTSRDWADYTTVTEHTLFVGKPDVEVTDITFTTDWAPTSPKIYKNDTVNITAHLTAHNATVEDVDVSIEIFDIGNSLTVFTQLLETTIIKDKDNLFSFSWKANRSSDFNVTITLDPIDLIAEENESNNEKTEKITVYNWPDLKVDTIILPSEQMTEFSRVKIDVGVSNIGEGNAADYEVVLYLERVTQGIMRYTNEIDSKLFSLNNNASKTVSLYWNSAVAGEWLVGAKIIVSDTKRDTDKENNRLLAVQTLKIKSFEKNNPVIKNISADPHLQEQGKPVTITANITDDTGLESVKIIVTTPLNYSYNEKNMFRTTGDKFEYTFKNTLWTGTYKFEIKVADLSVHSNKASGHGNFTIYEDETSPVIMYYEASPTVQLVDGFVDIICVATDNMDIRTVRAFIFSPDAQTNIKTLSWTSDGKYVYSNFYTKAGRYTFHIEVEDDAGNIVTTDYDAFWITNDLGDTDNDGMSDEWEKRYKLDPKDPNDANGDDDDDGLTNLEEYQYNTNPKKNIFGENVGARLKDNAWYIAGSIVLFLLILLLSIYGYRRRSK